MAECVIDGLRWFIRDGTTDWNTVNACSACDEYGIADLDLRGKLVFDIGAHIGGFAVKCASKGAEVVAVEPVPPNAALVQANAYLNGVGDRVAVITGALGADVVFWREGDAHGFIGNTWRNGEADFQEEVVRVYLAGLVNVYGPPDVVKLDCEGGEWAALEESTLHTVPLIVGEWHPTDGHTRADLCSALMRTHAVVTTGPEAGPAGFRATLR